METKEKVIATRHDLKSIELFMGYVDGYLSENITWNDLMPVVEKIESIDNQKFIIVIMQSSCGIIMQGKSEISPTLANVKGENKINATYNAIVQFINWYNLKQAEGLLNPYDENDIGQ